VTIKSLPPKLCQWQEDDDYCYYYYYYYYYYYRYYYHRSPFNWILKPAEVLLDGKEEV